MKRFLPFFLILVLTGAPTLVLGWDTPESFDKRYYAEQPQPIPQSPDDEVPDDEVPDDDGPDDGDEEKEDDDYD